MLLLPIDMHDDQNNENKTLQYHKPELFLTRLQQALNLSHVIILYFGWSTPPHLSPAPYGFFLTLPAAPFLPLPYTHTHTHPVYLIPPTLKPHPQALPQSTLILLYT